MKQILISIAVLFSVSLASAKTPAWLSAEVLLLREAAVAVAGAETCAAKSNILGQVYTLSRVIETMSQADAQSPNDVFALATLLSTYGVNARFDDACQNTDAESFAKVIDLLSKLEIALK